MMEITQGIHLENRLGEKEQHELSLSMLKREYIVLAHKIERTTWHETPQIKFNIHPASQVNKIKNDVQLFYVKQAFFTLQVFRMMMVASAFIVCLSHGSNDVGNAITPIVVLFEDAGYHVRLAFLEGSVMIALGLVILGKIVMETVGKDIIKLDFIKGFCSQISTGICVCLGSSIGLPLSTTHCMIGALAGVTLAAKTDLVSNVYKSVDESFDITSSDLTSLKKLEDSPGEAKVVNMKTVKKIRVWWGLTIPVTMATSALLTWIFRVIAKV